MKEVGGGVDTLHSLLQLHLWLYSISIDIHLTLRELNFTVADMTYAYTVTTEERKFDSEICRKKNYVCTFSKCDVQDWNF